MDLYEDPKTKVHQHRDAISIDINGRKIVYRSQEINSDDTVIDRAYRWRILAESLQMRYSTPRHPALRRRKDEVLIAIMRRPPPHNPPSVLGHWAERPTCASRGLHRRDRPCFPGGGRFTAPHRSSGVRPHHGHLQRGRVVSVPEPRVLPAPLAGSWCRGKGGVSSGLSPVGPVEAASINRYLLLLISIVVLIGGSDALKC